MMSSEKENENCVNFNKWTKYSKITSTIMDINMQTISLEFKNSKNPIISAFLQ